MNVLQRSERIQGILESGYAALEVAIIRRDRKLSRLWWQSRAQVKSLFEDVNLATEGSRHD